MKSLSTNNQVIPTSSFDQETISRGKRFAGKRVAMVTFSPYPFDPRPRRAANALVGEGASLDLICLAGENAPKHEVLDGINVLRVPLKHDRRGKLSYICRYTAFILISSIVLAFRSLARRYDLVYVHNMPDILVFSALVPKMLGAKVILDLHDPMPELMRTIFGLEPQSFSVRLCKQLERRSIALADSVVTVNRACGKLFTSRSCPPCKMNVVMNSPDERIFPRCAPRRQAEQGNAPDRPFRIMYHGSIVERNGLDLAIEALALVRKRVPAAELRIYGARTPFLARIEELIHRKGLEEAVRYFGPKSLEELVAVIQECDVGVIPNQRNVFTELNTPTRIFEYLALGTPVIAPRAAGICDYFDDSSMVFFELGNARDLAQKIEHVFDHPAEVLAVVRRGQLVHHQHDWSTERRRLISLVARVICKDGTSGEPVSLEPDTTDAEDKLAALERV
jgi:glycosyltransferase involved in cell wall biosynthesis